MKQANKSKISKRVIMMNALDANSNLGENREETPKQQSGESYKHIDF